MTELNIQTTTSPPEFTKTAPPAGLDPTNPSAPAAHDRPQHSTVLCVDSLAEAVRFRVAGDEQELAELATLTTAEQCDLERCEGVMRKNKESFRQCASALEEIRRRKLFRARFRSFAAYCQAVHGFGKSYAYRQAAAGKLFLGKSPMGEKLPVKSAHRRARSFRCRLAANPSPWQSFNSSRRSPTTFTPTAPGDRTGVESRKSCFSCGSCARS